MPYKYNKTKNIENLAEKNYDLFIKKRGVKKMQELAGKVITDEMLTKIRYLLSTGIEVLEKIQELREELNESLQAAEEQTGINKKILRKTIRSAYNIKKKGNKILLQEEKEVIDLVEALID